MSGRLKRRRTGGCNDCCLSWFRQRFSGDCFLAGDLDLDIDTHFFQRDTVFDGCLLVCGAFDDDGFAEKRADIFSGLALSILARWALTDMNWKPSII